MATVNPPEAVPSAAAELPPELIPCVDDLVTEDDTPVDNIYSEKQQRLLTEPLYSSWKPDRLFLALANVGLFYAVRKPPLVPDALLSLDVEAPADLKPKRNRSYFIWEFGKAPEAVIEIVSNKEGGEATDKMLKYAQIGILYYAIYDPDQKVQAEVLRVFVLRDKSYVPCQAEWLPVLNLGLTLWHGQFENTEDVWLRWCDREGNVIPTGAEGREQERQRAEQANQRAELERQRAEQANQRAELERQRAEQSKPTSRTGTQRAERERRQAEQERQRADQADQRAERLAAQLRDLGVKPDEV